MSNIEKRTLRLKRTFNAPRDLVWQAWTSPEHLTNWWGRGMPTKVVQHDFSEGGNWEINTEMPDGSTFRSYGQYSKIQPKDLIESSANFVPMTEGVTIIAEFKEAGEQCEFEFRVIHPTEEYARQQEDMGFYNGWGSIFEGLNGYLESL